MYVEPVTVEHHREPIGIGQTAPRLSWVPRTERPGWTQAAYEIEVSCTSFGRVESAESVLAPWPAGPLSDRDRRTVRVRVWGVGDEQPSAWSEPTTFEVGLL